MSIESKIIFYAVAIIMFVGLVNYLWNYSSSENFNCSDVVDVKSYAVFGSDVRMAACFGVITVDVDTSDPKSRYAYTLQDHKNDYEIAVLLNEKDYSLSNENLLFINVDPRVNNLSSYGSFYFVDGQRKPFIYRSYSDMPRYISVNIYSGEVTIYPNDLSEIPEVERSIFKDLEIIAN